MRKFFLVLLFSVCSLFAAVDINSASMDELMAVKGIGEKKAQSIIEYREKKCFDNIGELESVKGFGAKSIENLSEALEVKPCKKKD